MQFNHELFKERLRAVAKGEKNKEIADKIGVPPSTLSKWFSTDSKTESLPRITDLLKISEVYGVTIDYLVGNESAQEKDLTPRDICEMIVSVDRSHFFDLGFGALTAKCTHYDIDSGYPRPYDRTCNALFATPTNSFMNLGYDSEKVVESIESFVNDYRKIKGLDIDPDAKERVILSLLETVERKYEENRFNIYMSNVEKEIDTELPFA